jgi:beta-xylosidase
MWGALAVVALVMAAAPGASADHPTPATAAGVAHRPGLTVSAASTSGTRGPPTSGTRGLPTIRPLATGPVDAANAPDPSVLVVGGTYYAYTTNDGVSDVPVLESTNLVDWRFVGDAMSVLPAWVEYGDTWSPSVAPDPAGGYEMFYDAYDAVDGVQCIGRATAPSPIGPFVDPSSSPFVCQVSLGGSIDASVYRSRSGDVLVWKSDRTGDAIWAAPLGRDDASLVGSPVQLLTATAGWEDGIVEGPALADVGGTIYLFFGGNRWTTADYAIGAVACASPLGPCQAASDTPVLASGDGATGPGGPSFFVANHQLVMAYAAWVDGIVAGPDGRRGLFLAAVTAASP